MALSGGAIADKVVAAAISLSIAAYDTGPLSKLSSPDLDNWSALTPAQLNLSGLFVLSGWLDQVADFPHFDKNGYFLNGPNAAFVAKSLDGTLALVFRGSDKPFVGDYLNAAFGDEAAYQSLKKLIHAFVAYANDSTPGVSRILITGHSLGAELATLFATSEIGSTDNISNLNFLKSKIDVVAIASPGIPTTHDDFTGWDSRIINVFHSGDPIYNHIDGIKVLDGGLLHPKFVHPGIGTGVSIDLPDVDNGFSLNSAIAHLSLDYWAAEHSAALYQNSLNTIVNSSVSRYTTVATRYRLYSTTTFETVRDPSAGADNFVAGTNSQDTITGSYASGVVDLA